MEPSIEDQNSKKRELYTFLSVSFIVIPLLSVFLVGGYGFVIWMSHLIFGPPTI